MTTNDWSFAFGQWSCDVVLVLLTPLPCEGAQANRHALSNSTAHNSRVTAAEVSRPLSAPQCRLELVNCGAKRANLVQHAISLAMLACGLVARSRAQPTLQQKHPHPFVWFLMFV